MECEDSTEKIEKQRIKFQEEINSQMELKANKTSVANALQRKANKLDVETAMCKNKKESIQKFFKH